MIIEDSGAKDSAIGIAVSGRQVAWNYEATQAKHFDKPSHQPTGPYAQSLGQGASRFQRGHLVYQNMGHTAVFTRVDGKRSLPVVGFFPKEGLLGSLTPSGYDAYQGASVTGAWHDDDWMFGDQAALAFEIPVSGVSARKARDYLLGKLQQPDTRFQYQTRQDPGDSATASRNCVAAARLMLEELMLNCLLTPDGVDHQARSEIRRVTGAMNKLLAGRGYLQGQMQQLVQTGFTHLPP